VDKALIINPSRAIPSPVSLTPLAFSNLSPVRFVDPNGRQSRDLKNEFDQGMEHYCRQNANAEACGGRGTERTVVQPSTSKTHSDADAKRIENDLGFDPGGAGEVVTGLVIGIFGAASIAQDVAREAQRISNDLYGNNPTTGRNDEEDAFRHALASYMLTSAVGVTPAKAAGDAHERSVPNPQGERIMDLYNNHVGRQLATDPKNAYLPPVMVVLQALRAGKLMTSTLPMTSGSNGQGRTATKTYSGFRENIWNPYK
jgi:hypothetical protein